MRTQPPFKKRGKGPGPRGIRKAKIAARVGAGLSLDKLAGAKKSGYDPRVAKEKERALNAGKVNKYRKMLKRMEGDEAAAQVRTRMAWHGCPASTAQALTARSPRALQGAKKGGELAKPSGSDGSKPPSAGQDAQAGAAGAEPGQAAAAQQERGDRPGKQKKQKKKKPKSKLEQLAAENEAESVSAWERERELAVGKDWLGGLARDWPAAWEGQPGRATAGSRRRPPPTWRRFLLCRRPRRRRARSGRAQRRSAASG